MYDAPKNHVVTILTLPLRDEGESKIPLPQLSKE